MRQTSQPSGNDPEEFNLREIWHTLFRNRWVVLGTILGTMALTALSTWVQRPVFEAGASIRIDEKDPGAELLSDLVPIGGISKGKIETEMIVLRSRQIASAVVDSLSLSLELTEPERTRGSVIRAIRVPSDAPVGTYKLTRGADGTYSVEAEFSEGVSAALPRQVRIGHPFRIGSAELALNPALRSDAPPRIVIVIHDYQWVVTQLRRNLRISRPDPNAHIVGILYSSTDPELVAAIPNAVAHTFLEYKATLSKSESRNTVEFLRSQVTSYESQLRSAEDRLRTFRESNQVVSLGDEAGEQVRRMAEMRAQRDQLGSDRDALSNLLRRAGEGASSGNTSAYRQLVSFPVFLQNRAVQDLLQSLTALETDRSRLLVTRTEANTDVRGYDQRIHELETQLYQIARNYKESLDSQIASLDNGLRQFGARLEAIPAREVDFARLSRQQELLANIYTLLNTRLKEAEIREAVEPGDVRIVDLAIVPRQPIAPRPLRNLFLGCILGVVFGIGLAFLRKALDTKVRTREDAETATAGAPILGAIPRIRLNAGLAYGIGNGNGRRNGKPALNGNRLARDDSPTRLITREDPTSPASEAYRSLRTNLTFASTERTPQVVVVTSAMPGDGKSTSASNLAITLAQQGTRTLLIDADLRRGVLDKLFGTRSEPGLTHVLVGRATLSDAIVQVPVTDAGLMLNFLPAGVFPPNPAELLGSSRMKELLEQMRDQYEMIVFDAPPLNLVTDAAVLGTSADATVLIARIGSTDKRALEYAARQVQHLRSAVTGVVLNDVDVAAGGYYGYGYGYGYGRRRYASETAD
jgi:tyrosine-protein kinase Etk/Wzc